MFYIATLRSFLMICCVALFTVIYSGCSGSEETTAEDEMVTDTGVEEEQAPEEQPTTEDAQTPEEQPQDTQQEEQQPTVAEHTEIQPTQPEGPSRERLQSELDSLKTENVQLKEQLSITAHTNKELTAKVSDLEAANAAVKSRPMHTKAESHSVSGIKSSSEEIRVYEAALAKFNSKNYSTTISELQSLLESGIKDDYAPNCHYWIGLSHFQSKDYTTALQHFQQVMSYRYSAKKDDAQIMIARTYERMGEKEQAQAEYKKLIEMYPTSEYISRARSRAQ